MMLPTVGTEDWKKRRPIKCEKLTYQKLSVSDSDHKLCKINFKMTLQGNLDLNCSIVLHQTYQGINFSRNSKQLHDYLHLHPLQMNTMHTLE